ncbi:MAG: hypothetical protein E7441_12150 [Ruminococcaceae bacterium]|nr:hypothetical protein [Oscillospiraceae bacterium]
MKKIISIFLVLCMMATLLPTVAFATEGDGETVAPIVADFAATTLTNRGTGNTSYEGNTVGYTIDTAKSTTLGVNVNWDGAGLQFQNYRYRGETVAWPTDNSQNQMLTINVTAQKEGYYSSELIYEAFKKSGEYTTYINGQFAGVVDAYDTKYNGGKETDVRNKVLNTVFLNEGTNEISFRCTKQYIPATEGGTWFIVDKLTLTYCGDNFTPVNFSNNIPASVNAGKPVEFSVSASINENLKKFYATYDEAGIAITNPEGTVTVTSEDGTVALTNQTATGATGTFTANAAGKATLTASTTINGKTYTENFEVDVIGPIVADFTKVDKKRDVTFDEIRAAGIDVVDDKTTDMTKHGGIWSARGIRTTHYVSGALSATWPNVINQNLMFTFNVTAIKEGYYSPVLDYDVCTVGGIYAIYINGQYAGTVDAYDESATTKPAPEKAKLNTVYLKEGKNEVSYRCVAHGPAEEASWFFIVNLTLTPCDEDFEVGIQDTVAMSVTGTAGKVTVDGTVQNSDTETYSKNVGDTVTVVAEDIAGKIFRGWLRGGENGTVVCLEKEYSFTAATNVALYAKYTDAPAESGEVSEYYDWNGEFLADKEPASETLSKYGFTFKEWKSTVVNGITRYVADYVTKNTYAITKPSNVNADKDLDSISHETPITLKSETPVSWYVNEKLVACGDTYTFLATQAARVLTDGLVTVGPIVNLTKPEGDTYILEYNANGKTVIEKGIIFGEAGASVTSCSYKVISQRNDACGKLMAENDKNCAKVRGYIIYNDNGTYRVVYADIAE